MRWIALSTVLLIAGATPLRPMTVEQRREYLQRLLQTLPEAKSFREWLDKTGELPPDFDALPRNNDLPDPLKFLDGRQVRTPQEWNARRAEIKELAQKYLLGVFPPRPKIVKAVTINEIPGDGARVRRVALEFAQTQAKLGLELYIPDGKGPFPVLMGPGVRFLAPLALRRGYICVQYAGSDFQDDAGALAASLYPQHDLAQIPLRAWADSVALDYLTTLPEVDQRAIAITGHSRDGKQALVAAAFDERITAVIPSSSGAGGTYPYRLGGERGQSEGIEAMTRRFPTWFHPRMRFFVGREDRLPVDGNLLVALVAPRATLVSFALNDSVEGAWADEQAYLSALKAYKLLGHPERLGVISRPGGHGILPAVHEEYLDWLDIQFGRSARTWNSDLIFNHDFEQWRSKRRENSVSTGGQTSPPAASAWWIASVAGPTLCSVVRYILAAAGNSK